MEGVGGCLGADLPFDGSHWKSEGKARGLGANPPAAGDRRVLGGRSSQRWGDFCNFLIKITHFYAYFSQNRYFKVITHQLKAFKISLNILNGINEIQVL